MQVAQYTFQSPSSSAVQVGKLDPTSLKQESKSSQAPNTNETAQKAQSFADTEVKEVVPTVNSNHSLDVFA